MVNGRWWVTVPDHIADWLPAQWETERFESMAAHLHLGMRLFDIGAEQGYLSAVYAQFVGAQHMVLIEPTPVMWPNIKATWHANSFPDPLACWCGLLSDRTDLAPENLDVDPELVGVWPRCSWGGQLQTGVAYRLIWEHADRSPQYRLDDYVTATGIVPDALTIDTEGAEVRILRGATGVLRRHRPLVWVSVHPDMIAEHYGQTAGQLHEHMALLGYHMELLAVDHEEHWFGVPEERWPLDG